MRDDDDVNEGDDDDDDEEVDVYGNDDELRLCLSDPSPQTCLA